MATVWMRAKLTKLKREATKARAARWMPLPDQHDTITPREGVVVKRVASGSYEQPTGKGRRQATTRTYGNYKPYNGAVVWDLGAPRLLVAGR